MNERLLEAIKALKQSQSSLIDDIKILKDEIKEKDSLDNKNLFRAIADSLANYSIGDDGFWHFNGRNIGVRAEGIPGKDGKDAPLPNLKIGKVETSPEYGGANAKLRDTKKGTIYLDLTLPRGPQGFVGFDGKNATINGKNAINIEAGRNVTITQEDDTLTISARGGGSGGNATDVQINGVSITDDEDVANIITKSTYNASTNRIATEADLPEVPTNVSAFTNDAGYLTSFTEVDPVFSASVAASITSSDIDSWDSKGTYSKPNSGIPYTDLASAVQTSLDKADSALQTHQSIKTINSTSLVGVGDVSVQETLVSGTNIKTINNQSILGSGNITISGGGGTGDVADVYYDDESVLDSNKIAQLYSEIYIGSTAPTKSQKIWIDTTESDVALKDLQDDTTHRLVTDTEKTTWNGKQDALVSGTNIKTINNESILGSGNITIQGGGSSTDVQINGTSIVNNDVANIITNTAYNASSNKIATMSDVPDISGKQDTLVSGTNIKTINNQSILGSGNITISGGGGTATDVQVNGVSIVSNDVANLLTKTAYDAETNKLATESDLFSGDYDDLTDKPKLNNIPISGNKTPQMYGLQPAGNYATNPTVTTNQINATYSFTLNNNTEYRNTIDMTSITLTLPATIDTNYCSWLVFPSGSTATSLTYPNTILWSGDDVSNNAFVPVSDKTYNVCFWYDSINVNAVVRGV